MANWKDKLSVYDRKFVARTIGGTTWNFYPISFGRMFELKRTIKEVFGAMAIFFGKHGDDVGQEVENIKQGDSTISRTSITATTPEMAKLRDDQRRNGIESAVETLMSDNNRDMLGRLLADSLREDFDRDVPAKEINDFMAQLDLGQLVEFMQGFMEANAKVFGPLGLRAKSAIEAKLNELQPQAVASATAPSAPQP